MSSTSHQESAKDLNLRCAIITCSDTRTNENDTSGAYIRSALEAAGHEIAAYEIVKDEPDQIRKILDAYASQDLDVVLLNGGTGISAP